MTNDRDISLTIQIPDDIHERLQSFLVANPTWSQDDFMTSALSLLLVQLGDSSRDRDVRLYLDRMFYRLWGKETA